MSIPSGSCHLDGDDDDNNNNDDDVANKNSITDACSTADCCPLLTICPRCCPRHAPDDVIIHCGYQRLPLDGAVIGTFEHCSFIFLIEPQFSSEAILG